MDMKGSEMLPVITHCHHSFAHQVVKEEDGKFKASKLSIKSGFEKQQKSHLTPKISVPPICSR